MMRHTAKIAAQGLRPEIQRLAEQACDQILPRRKQVAIPREVTQPPELPPQPRPDEIRSQVLSPSEGRSAWISSWEPRRPPRPMGRWK